MGIDVVLFGVLVPGLAGALELAGVRDGLPDLLLGFDDLEGETHRHVPSDMTMHPNSLALACLLRRSNEPGILTTMLQGYRSRTR